MTLPLKIKKILLEPDPRLRAPNDDVTETWDELEPWVRLMWKAMRNGWTQGAGLAAPQVGWNVRLFIMDVDFQEHKPEHRCVFWNPVIMRVAGQPTVLKEGCLSLPNVWGGVLRFPEVVIHAMSPGGPTTRIFKGLAAQCIQHEMDHLAGQLCKDKLTQDPTVRTGERGPEISPSLPEPAPPSILPAGEEVA